MESLWPDLNLDPINAAVSPVAVLREQVEFLAETTKNAIVAEARKIRTDSNDFMYGFDLYARKINYRCRLFTVCYGVLFFPTSIRPDERIIAEVNKKERSDTVRIGERMNLEANSIEEFKKHIKEILGCESTKKILAAILSHVNAESPVSA
ncbi:MAG: hypothetical protein HQM02_01205 [Magnetococcales bacterium]|nr:hypothetical protein [Magnetococcales bacterium]